MRWWPSNVPFKFTKRANLANLSGMSHPWWPVFLIWKQYLISFENIFLFVPFEPKIFSSMAFRILFFPFQFSLGILHSQFRILFFPHGISQKAFSHFFFHPFSLLIFTHRWKKKSIFNEMVTVQRSLRILFFFHMAFCILNFVLQKAFSHSFFHPFSLLIFTFRPNVNSRPLKPGRNTFIQFSEEELFFIFYGSFKFGPPTHTSPVDPNFTFLCSTFSSPFQSHWNLSSSLGLIRDKKRKRE